VLLGLFHEAAQSFHGGDEFFREFFVFLVLPGAAEGVEPGLKGAGPILHLFVETFEFRCETADLVRVHDGLGHEGIKCKGLGPHVRCFHYA